MDDCDFEFTSTEWVNFGTIKFFELVCLIDTFNSQKLAIIRKTGINFEEKVNSFRERKDDFRLWWIIIRIESDNFDWSVDADLCVRIFKRASQQSKLMTINADDEKRKKDE